ncbi:MAG: hypothetical protein Q8R76_07205 [Candidatus Omnitrophota bacterium]|nr:hypothetical protein [Candidatus Omnitrophota bacterium]
MSLRSFHIFFIVLSIATLAWFGTWSVAVNLGWAVAAFGICISLVFYLFWFLGKTRKMGTS